MRYLTEHGAAAVISSNDENEMPLHVAAKAGHFDVYTFLKTKMGSGALLAQTTTGTTPMHFAAGEFERTAIQV